MRKNRMIFLRRSKSGIQTGYQGAFRILGLVISIGEFRGGRMVLSTGNFSFDLTYTEVVGNV